MKTLVQRSSKSSATLLLPLVYTREINRGVMDQQGQLNTGKWARVLKPFPRSNLIEYFALFHDSHLIWV